MSTEGLKAYNLNLVTAVDAANIRDSLFWRDPAVTLRMVRNDFRAVAQWENAHGRDSIWAQHPHDAAICIVMGIDPQTGDPIDDVNEALARYAKSPFLFMDEVRFYYDRLMASPIIQRELAKEALAAQQS